MAEFDHWHVFMISLCKTMFGWLAAGLLLTALHPSGIMLRADTGDVDPQAALRRTVPSETDASARRLLQLHAQARGADALEKIRNWRGSGTLRQGRNDYRIKDYAMAPNLWRRDRTERIGGREITVVEGFDGVTGWQMDMSRRNPLPERMGPDQLREIALLADFTSPLLDWRQKGLVFSYLGEERSRGRDEHIVRMFYPDGHFVDFYLDHRNRLVTRISRIEILGNAIVTNDTFITRYERLQGVWMPKAMSFTINGQPFGRLEYKELELNTEMDPDIFAVPEVEEVWLRQQR